MTLDFQQVRRQVIEMGEGAWQRYGALRDQRQRARQTLRLRSADGDELRQKIERVASTFDKLIRTGVPAGEPLDARFPLPPIPSGLTLLAGDGSQILPDRNAPVDFCLINVGALQMVTGSPEPPAILASCQLLSGDRLLTDSGPITESRLALMRDFAERTELAKLALQAPPPAITLTDGPLDLWMGPNADAEDRNLFEQQRVEYLNMLDELRYKGHSAAGYVDKPGADLLVRMLEISLASEADLPEIRRWRPLRGVRDVDLFADLLQPGERSAVFELRSRSADIYTGDLALHFFYLNVGRPGQACWSRVEIPAWVAFNEQLLNNLHAVLVAQSQVMGSRPYPYLLHRAHETALVTLQEKEEVANMIALELQRRGLEVGQASNKQSAKDLHGRTRYSNP
jgi:hypothetical protein